MEIKNDIISKYNISEQDLYTLGIIEAKKSTAGFFEKEKLKAKSMGVLKPYNVKFMDLGNLLSAIKTQEYHANQTLIEKYGNIDLEAKASSMGLKYVIPIAVGIVVFLYIFNSSSYKSISYSDSESSIENTQKCLVGYDWVYPSGNNPTGAWKFSSDGTFNSSTTMFGGMSTWGNWQVISPEKIKISYTRTTKGIIPDDQILTMSSCSSLKVGSTVYLKD